MGSQQLTVAKFTTCIMTMRNMKQIENIEENLNFPGKSTLPVLSFPFKFKKRYL